MNFISSLENMLSEPHNTQIVSWSPHNNSFRIHDQAKFTRLMPTYFRSNKLESFMKQLRNYGFTRNKHDMEFGHSLFPRNGRLKKHLATLQPRAVKSTGKRGREATDGDDSADEDYKPATTSEFGQKAGCTLSACDSFARRLAKPLRVAVASQRLSLVPLKTLAFAPSGSSPDTPPPREATKDLVTRLTTIAQHEPWALAAIGLDPQRVKDALGPTDAQQWLQAYHAWEERF